MREKRSQMMTKPLHPPPEMLEDTSQAPLGHFGPQSSANLDPPTVVIHGDDAGKSGSNLQLDAEQAPPTPSSPLAARIVTPRAASFWNSASTRIT